MRRSLDEAGYRCIDDPTVAWIDTWDSIVRAMQTSSAVFAAAKRMHGGVEFQVDDEVLRIAATGPTMHTDAGTWITALWLALVCRERQRIDMLCATPIDLLRASGARYDAYIYYWVRALQMVWRGEEGVIDQLLAAMRGTDPEILQVASPELMLQILYPPIEIFYHLTQRDEEKVNDSLATALNLHRSFWGKDEERRNDPNGFIALGPLAVACLARDTGLFVDVESAYLSEHLLLGTWVGEHAT
ncbi:immunity 49 family protein [Nocardia sp. 2YAB30]|uniref:immunity 49 family protein n=1 Tax=Nocardia sp. 2YAB30 TaxID=3233022 RepID=UPI003F979490